MHKQNTYDDQIVKSFLWATVFWGVIAFSEYKRYVAMEILGYCIKKKTGLPRNSFEKKRIPFEFRFEKKGGGGK